VDIIHTEDLTFSFSAANSAHDANKSLNQIARLKDSLLRTVKVRAAPVRDSYTCLHLYLYPYVHPYLYPHLYPHLCPHLYHLHPYLYPYQYPCLYPCLYPYLDFCLPTNMCDAYSCAYCYVCPPNLPPSTSYPHPLAPPLTPLQPPRLVVGQKLMGSDL
jgi:hypothetical protein